LITHVYTLYHTPTLVLISSGGAWC